MTTETQTCIIVVQITDEMLAQLRPYAARAPARCSLKQSQPLANNHDQEDCTEDDVEQRQNLAGEVGCQRWRRIVETGR